MRKLSLFFLLATLALPIKAQGLLSDRTAPTFLTLTKESPLCKQLSALLHVPLDKVRMSYRYSRTVRINAVAEQTQLVALYLEQEHIAGTTKYKGFDLSRFCWPDTLAYGFVLRQTGTVIIATANEQHAISDLQKGIKQQFISKLSRQPITDKLELKEAIFSTAKLDGLSKYVADIDLYTETTAAALSAGGWAKKIAKAQDPDTLDKLSKAVEDLTTRLAGYKSLITSGRLALSEDEKTVALNVHADALKHIATARQELSKKVGDGQQMLLTKADKLFHTARRDRALPYYRRLYALAPGAEHVVPRLTLLTLEDGDFRTAIRLLVTNAQLMQGFSNQRVVDKSGRALEQAIVTQVRANRQAEATSDISLMDSLCKRFPGYRCPDMTYAKPQAPVRTDFVQTINKARTQVSLNQIDEGLASAEQALAIAKEGNLPMANLQTAQTLLKQVAERKATLLVYAAQEKFKVSKDSAGAALLGEEYALQIKFEVAAPPLRSKLVDGKLKPYLAKLLATKKPADRALAAQFAERNGLDVTQPMGALPAPNDPKSASMPDCKKVQNQINELVNKGVKAERQLDYINAYPYYQKAESIRAANVACLINKEFIAQKLDAAKPAFVYQTSLAKVEKSIDNNRYDTAIQAYAACQQIYESAKLSEAFLQLPPLSSFYRNPKELGFSLFFAKRCADNGELDTAIAVVQFAAKQRASKKQLDLVTPQLAKALAERDHKRNPSANDAAQRAAQYSSRNTRLADFEKQYIKAW